MSQFTVMNGIINDIVTFFSELRMTKCHDQGTMNNKMLQFSIMNDTMNDIGNDKKGSQYCERQVCP